MAGKLERANAALDAARTVIRNQAQEIEACHREIDSHIAIFDKVRRAWAFRFFSRALQLIVSTHADCGGRL